MKEKNIQKIEFEKLLYQINPHFLLNTLNSIQWMAQMSHQREISEFVQRLKKLLSYNLGKEGRQTTLRMELEIVKEYIALQQMRYDFIIEMNIEDGRRCFCIDLSFMPTTIIISAVIGHIALFTGITVPTIPCVICPVPFRTVSMLCVTVSAGRCPFFFAADIYVPFHIGFLRIAGFVDYVAFLPYNIRNAVPAFVILEFRCLSFKFFISKYKFMYCLLWLLLCHPIPPFFLIHTPRPVSVFHLFSFPPFPEVPLPLPW
jgi:hypothetical protein